MTDTVLKAFDTQANFCRQSGSAMTATILQTLGRIIDHRSRTGARILDWPGHPMADALTLRIAGGLNALARSGQDEALTALYRSGEGDWDAVLARVLAEWDDWLFPWLDSAPQTNEVARSGVLWPGLLTIAEQFGPKLELIELGASGGLNLNMDRFGYDLGGRLSGDLRSPLRFVPVWQGAPPPQCPIDIAGRSAVDLNPLDLTDPAVADHLLAYIWPDQPERIARAEAAIRIACAHPPLVEKADGAEWLEKRLAEPQAEGVTRVIYHSVALQYFPREGRARVEAAIEAAGQGATEDRPLAWLSMEFREVVTVMELRLRCWPAFEEDVLLARAHPHGARVEWLV